MINNITNVDTHLPMSAAKASSSMFGRMSMPPLLSFKKPPKKDKAELRSDMDIACNIRNRLRNYLGLLSA